jgi:hypothetical protein
MASIINKDAVIFLVSDIPFGIAYVFLLIRFEMAAMRSALISGRTIRMLT